MWAHYADGFCGICIAYPLAKLTRQLSNEHSLARIAYGDRLFYMTLPSGSHSERAKAVLSTKNLLWTYEREWRLFAPGPGPVFHGADVVKHLSRIPHSARGSQDRHRKA
jgi:hypothetical protein